MSSGEFLSIEPQELKFPFELKKQISCAIQLSNRTDNFVAFKVKTTNPKKYCVRPNTGIVLPRTTCDVIVTMQAQREVPPDIQCKDKFLLQSVIAKNGATVKDIVPEMFNKESGNLVEECKLRVLYVSPPQPPSPVPEESEEGSSPRASLSDNGNLNASSFDNVSRDHAETKDKSSELADLLTEVLKRACYRFLVDKLMHTDALASTSRGELDIEARVLIQRLAEEKNSIIQQNNKLLQDLELLRRESSKRRGGFSVLYVVLVGLLGIIIGYLVRT